jgi:hypothetical protein
MHQLKHSLEIELQVGDVSVSALRKAGLLKPVCRPLELPNSRRAASPEALKPASHACHFSPQKRRKHTAELHNLSSQVTEPSPVWEGGSAEEDFVEWIDICHLCTRTAMGVENLSPEADLSSIRSDLMIPSSFDCGKRQLLSHPISVTG